MAAESTEGRADAARGLGQLVGRDHDLPVKLIHEAVADLSPKGELRRTESDRSGRVYPSGMLSLRQLVAVSAWQRRERADSMRHRANVPAFAAAVPHAATLREVKRLASRYKLTPWQAYTEVARAGARLVDAVHEWAQDADPESPRGNERTRRRSERFERAVARWLDQRGVLYLTESDQRVAARADPTPRAQTPATPDFLLRDDGERLTSSSGEQLYWLDAKDMFGVDMRYLAAKARKTVAKYNAAFGPGALVFSAGVVQGFARTFSDGVELLGGQELHLSDSSGDEP